MVIDLRYPNVRKRGDVNTKLNVRTPNRLIELEATYRKL